MNAYIVFKPGKNNTESVYAVFAELDEAKESAQWLRDKYLAKGWDGWAKQVAIRKPTNPKIAQELANELIQKGNLLDMGIQGNTYRGDGKVIASLNMDALYKWASILRNYAKTISA